MSKQACTKEQFIEKANLVHKNKYDYSITNYINSNTKIKINCNMHGHFEQMPYSHLNGNGCKKCHFLKMSKVNTKTTDLFIKQSIAIHFDKYDYSKVNYTKAKNKVIIVCKICNIEFAQEPANHLNGSGCPNCSKILHIKSNTKDQNDFINDLVKIHGNRYDYSLVKYIKSKNKIKIICKQCNNIFLQDAGNHKQGQGCPICNKKSSGESTIRHFLKINNIKFEEQKRLHDCKNKNPLPFDFYLPNYNLLIEYDGIQHFIGKSFSSNKSLEFKSSNLLYTQKNDRIKTSYCLKNEFNLLRISYLNFNKIEDILNSLLFS